MRADTGAGDVPRASDCPRLMSARTLMDVPATRESLGRIPWIERPGQACTRPPFCGGYKLCRFSLGAILGGVFNTAVPLLPRRR
jgi:hypothetical protein